MPRLVKVPRVQIRVGIDWEVLSELKEIATERNTTATKLAEELIIKGLKNIRKKKS